MTWLAYGCSIGARVKTSAFGYATVVSIRKDDTCEVRRDNAAETTTGPAASVLDPRPDTMSKTTSPQYKPGQKLMLMHEGALFVDAVVEEHLGVRQGSRHRVRIGRAGAGQGCPQGQGRWRRQGQGPARREGDARGRSLGRQPCQAALLDRRQVRGPAAALPRGAAHAPLVGEGRGDHQGHPRVRAAVFTKLHSPSADGLGGEGNADDADDAKDAAGGHDEGGADGSAPPTAAAAGGAPGGDAPASEPPTSVLKLLEELADGEAGGGVALRCGSRQEHDLMHQQALYALASRLRDGEQSSPIRLLPLSLSMSKLAEMLNDAREKSTSAGDLLIKAVVAGNPAASEMLRQARSCARSS